MRRVLSMLLVLAALGLVAPPAHAALSVTISVSRTTLANGSAVVFSGRAVYAKRGSVVRLQRKVGAGWKTVASRKVWSTRAYRFTTTPPHGYQYYRVLKPRQLRQARAVSRTVRLTVRWRPGVALGAVRHEVGATGTVTTTAGGRVTWLPAGTLLRRELRGPDGRWTTHGRVSVSAVRTWRDTFTSSHGWRLRYTAPGSGARLAASSASFVVDGRWTPTIAVTPTMDSLTDQATVSGTSTGLSEGSTVQRERQDGELWVAEGYPVPVDADGTFTDSFTVTMNGGYRYTAAAAELRQEATSTPFAFTEAPTGRVSLNTTTAVVFPAGGTERTLLLHLDEGQTFTYHGPYWVTESVTDPSGAPVSGFGPADATVTVVAPRTGDYTIRLLRGSGSSWHSATAQITLSTPVEIATSVDAPSLDLASTLPGQVVDLMFAAAGNSVVSEYAAPDPQLGRSRGVVTLLDSSGAVVPTWGQLVREGKIWRLPAISGNYTLRVTPGGGDLVGRHDQSVLAGHEATMTVDGAPGHVSLDRQGRVGVVTVTVPEGLNMRLSDTGPPHLAKELFGPDGQRIPTYSISPGLDPTVAGTYTQLVSYTGTAEVDFYASTPATYDVELGATVAFDQGPAPAREALIRVPVTAGQLFSIEVLDDNGEPCWTGASAESGRELVEWLTNGHRHPSVVKVDQTGELVLSVTFCTATGTLRLTPAVVVPGVVTGTSTDQNGDTTTITTATLEATSPGQVMLMEYDAGLNSPNRIEVRTTGSSLPTGTWLWTAHAEPGSSSSYGAGMGTAETFANTLFSLTGPTYFFVYAGHIATGTLGLEFNRLDY